MRYLLAFFLPPLALLACGRLVAFVLNATAYAFAWITLPLGFGFFFWLGCAVHACLDVSRYYADRRARELQTALAAAMAPMATVAKGLREAKPTESVLVTPKKELGNYDAARDVWRL